jgi:hypothetical protein
MALLEELGVDPKAVNAKEVEDQIKAGGLPPVGMHHAVLQGFREGSANSGTKFRELVFAILAGPGKGFEVKETLYNSDKQRGKNRILIFAHRLGLLKKDGNSFVAIPGKEEFSDCIGTTCVIDVTHEEREYTDDRGTKKKTTDVKLTFEGVLSMDDPRCKDIPKAGAAAVAAAGKAAASKPKDNYESL